MEAAPDRCSSQMPRIFLAPTPRLVSCIPSPPWRPHQSLPWAARPRGLGLNNSMGGAHVSAHPVLTSQSEPVVQVTGSTGGWRTVGQPFNQAALGSSGVGRVCAPAHVYMGCMCIAWTRVHVCACVLCTDECPGVRVCGSVHRRSQRQGVVG